MKLRVALARCASGLDGLRALEIVLAAYASGQDHEPKAVSRTGPGL